MMKELSGGRIINKKSMKIIRRKIRQIKDTKIKEQENLRIQIVYVFLFLSVFIK